MWNKSASYVLPLYLNHFKKEGYNINNDIIVKYLINCYIFDEGKEFDNLFTLAFYNDINIKETTEQLKNSKLFINSIVERDRLVLQFVQDNFKKHINLFVLGKYSKIEEKNKKIILDFAHKYFRNTIYLKIGQVLTRNKNLEKELAKELGLHNLPENTELSSKINSEIETFTLNTNN